MPLDAITIRGLTEELSLQLMGSKIDKIQQPERDLVLVTLRGRGETMRLVLSCAVGAARIHLTDATYENPQQPPMFCMLLRKHLLGARLTRLYQPAGERMVILDLDAFDEMGAPVKRQLALEMIGRNTNLILVGEDGHIIDCLRRVDSEMSTRRQVLPGLLYHLPPSQERPDFIEADTETRKAVITDAPESQLLDKYLVSAFSGLSPLISREICYRAFGDASPLCGSVKTELKTLSLCMDAVADAVRNREYFPCLLIEGEKPMEFSFMAIEQYGERVICRQMASFSQLLDTYYTGRQKIESMRRRSANLLKTVRTTRDRVARKLASQQEELWLTGKREEKRICGDLITANLYRMKKGAASVLVEDYYAEGCPQREIPLDPLKTPQQNAAAYYREYTKAKKAEQHLTVLIQENSRDLAYLNSVLDEIERAESEADLAEIRRELTETGYIRRQRSGKREKIREQQPLRFVSTSGFEIFVGRNNQMNDKLTTKIARRTDIWLHAQKIHGSHVIISAQGKEVDTQTLEEAAALAAYYSQARAGGKIPVDYTQVRFVKKPSGALPGMVIYTEYRTILAEADKSLMQQLQDK
jgi:predicted ribosome quality control (RQC) complex YloA/Tae2 family protein